ncbi:lanthionine synthetase C family protein [Kitasatospora nipponensis]|uniref:Lanthionine synthetase C family protein n=1 Tax=Kitasatospora nipponensis TaxID=258049 RepID=A0ABN1WAB8_9ACTN
MIRAYRVATLIADRLAWPTAVAAGPFMGALPQSLTKGTAGIALLHIERAATGHGDWDTVHRWLTAAMRTPVTSDPATGLFYGAPAIAFAVHAATIGPGAYTRALTTLDGTVARMTNQRVRDANARIDRGEHPQFAEYDLIYGLTGLGAHYRLIEPHGQLLRRILAYLVRLTEPLPDGLPGWWTDLAPSGDLSPSHPGGHGNLGMAHGITGPLALLSLALRDGISMPGQPQAIERICGWLDSWRQEGDHGPWWPEAVTLAEHRDHTTRQSGPLRPSWCYGTPGIARAQQLAGQALGQPGRRQLAVDAMAACLADPAQTNQVIDHTLCHGSAGLLQTARRMADDCGESAISDRLPRLLEQFLVHVPQPIAPGLLEGAAGLALALHAADGRPPGSPWDACLLLN